VHRSYPAFVSIPQPWQGEAFNQVPESENRIHSDEVARRYGFRGGLVPGVTVTAYLCHSAIDAWGLDWLERGLARAVVSTPLYDGKRFRVEIDNATARAYDAELFDETGTRCATASVELPETLPTPPAMRGDPRIGEGFVRPRASREVMEELRERGMHAMRARWDVDGSARIAGYLRKTSEMPKLVQPEGDGYANPAFVLGLTNWVLGSNVIMEAWLHLQTESQHYRAIPRGSELVVESAVADLFEKKGHEFIDLDVAAYLLDTEEPVLSARLRAIYRLRGS
jgi:hypothetical protein